MTERILIAGFGGQGLVFIGKLLARIALSSWNNLTFFPAYGAEVRGGTSNCQVILSAEEIASPLAEEFDDAIIMNQPSVERFLPMLDAGGTGIINGSMCEQINDKRLRFVNATFIADTLGDTRAANFVMLGALLAAKKLVKTSDVESEIKRTFGKAGDAAIELNLNAFREGLNAG